MSKGGSPSKRELWAAHLLYASGQEDQAKLDRAVQELDLKPPRQQRATKPRKEREGGIQDAILAMLRLHPRVAWAVHIRTGAYEIDGRYIAYGFKGCSDILGQLRPSGKLLALECKQPGWKKPRDERERAQEAFINRVREAGGVAGFVTSVDEAAAVLAAEGAWK